MSRFTDKVLYDFKHLVLEGTEAEREAALKAALDVLERDIVRFSYTEAQKLLDNIMDVRKD